MYLLTMETTRIAVIGAGYVWLPLAVEYDKHRPVVVFDINDLRLAPLDGGHDSTLEVIDNELSSRRLLNLGSRLED